ncbi:MAG: hypothetical protein GY913_22545 [Proteobacteria bacterium]|nr:hypothetical protein [Pseudomonadota bacterium]MCP4919690.1 hypothetical protein [Pseudomonadota bacterium]
MHWNAAVEGDQNRFREAAQAAPGWYWVLRPRQNGPQSYGGAVRFLVHVGADGTFQSPVAAMRSVNDVVCLDAASGTRFGTWFAGPVTPGEQTATVAPLTTSEGVRAEITGSLPRTPGWHWCQTGPVGLALVNADGIGPVFLQEDSAGTVQVFLCDSVDGTAVDVGEFGFSEPLVSAGGVIDSSGTVGRKTATFFGPLSPPQGVPSSLEA